MFPPTARRAALACLLAAAACQETLDPITGTQSLRVELVSPADPGSSEDRLDDGQREVTLTVSALDEDAAVDASFSGDVDIYVHFLGGLTPKLEDEPLDSVHLEGGSSGEVTLSLPPVFGPTFLWMEHTRDDDATFATGTSPTLWYRDPFLVDVSRPEDEMALDALESSPLEEKQINVTGSRYGASGRMVVTGVYAQGYTLSDAECADADGTPPCVTGDYDHVFVFSFNRPRGEDGEAIAVGDVVERLTGAIGEFNGLTEVNFPQSFMSGEGDPAMVPEPFVLQPEWLTDVINMEKVEEALVAVDGVEICPLDDDYDTYAQWKLKLGGSCDDGDVINVITRGQVNDFDPAAYVGMVMPRVVGTLRPVNIGNFNVWILYPRSIEDIELP
jgi:hypothetical protein